MLIGHWPEEVVAFPGKYSGSRPNCQDLFMRYRPIAGMFRSFYKPCLAMCLLETDSETLFMLRDPIVYVMCASD